MENSISPKEIEEKQDLQYNNYLAFTITNSVTLAN